MNNTLTENIDNIKVVCRFRPLNESEIEKGDSINMRIVENSIQITTKNQRSKNEKLPLFVFDYVFNTKAK